MIHPIANAPCSWGVDDPKNPNLPAWATVLKEAAQAGYRSIELGPWGYLPTDPASLRAALEQHQLSLVAGTIFDDLVSEAHFPTLVALTHQICRNLSQALEASWKFIDPILLHWKEEGSKNLFFYEPGEDGPEETVILGAEKKVCACQRR